MTINKGDVGFTKQIFKGSAIHVLVNIIEPNSKGVVVNNLEMWKDEEPILVIYKDNNGILSISERKFDSKNPEELKVAEKYIKELLDIE